MVDIVPSVAHELVYGCTRKSCPLLSLDVLYMFTGTTPVCSANYKGSQSLEGLQSGEKYMIMSCCDKMSRWAVLGIQGQLSSLCSLCM